MISVNYMFISVFLQHWIELASRQTGREIFLLLFDFQSIYKPSKIIFFDNFPHDQLQLIITWQNIKRMRYVRNVAKTSTLLLYFFRLSRHIDYYLHLFSSENRAIQLQILQLVQSQLPRLFTALNAFAMLFLLENRMS